jgi:putative acetyltransferase
MHGDLSEDSGMCLIRPENPTDHASIRHVNTLAFGQPNEADLVDALRRHQALTLSLVAVQDHRLVGHIAFSPVSIVSATTTHDALGLGPMGVLPTHQRQGIGSQLVESGLQACRDIGCGVVVVLGHPHYYPRFGFTPAMPYGIVWEHDAPEEAFMVKALQEGVLAQTRGVVKYRPEFDAV